MKASYLLTLALAFVAVTFSLCGKKAENVNPLYVGYWYASTPDNNYTLIIDENSEATYTISSALLDYTEYKGRARISGEKIRIGWKSFHIDQEPKTSSCGLCILTLDGIELHKQ